MSKKIKPSKKKVDKANKKDDNYVEKQILGGDVTIKAKYIVRRVTTFHVSKVITKVPNKNKNEKGNPKGLSSLEFFPVFTTNTEKDADAMVKLNRLADKKLGLVLEPTEKAYEPD